MVIDINKTFEEQSEEVQDEIRTLLQNEMQRRYQEGEGYPNFDDDGGITIELDYTDDNNNSFRLSEKRIQNYSFSEADRSVKSKTYNIKKL